MTISIKPVHAHGKGWDVEIRDAESGRAILLAGGRYPYTLHQAQVAAQSAERDEATHKIYTEQLGARR